MLTIGGTGIPGIFVALALCIAVQRGSMNRFFNCVFFGIHCQFDCNHHHNELVSSHTAHRLWSEVKQIGLMGKVWDWNNMYRIKLKKFDGWVLHAAIEDGDRGDDDATALPEGHGGGPKDGNDVVAPLEDNDGGQDNRGAALECGLFAVQVLAIRANFPVVVIYGYDWEQGLCLYLKGDGEVQENGMVDLVLSGPRRILSASCSFFLEVFYYTTAGDLVSIKEGWDVSEDIEVEEYTETICPNWGRLLEITFLVLPHYIEANVEVKLKLKDLGSVGRAVYGTIKAGTTCYGNKKVHLFSCERGRSLFFPSGSTFILPLSPSQIALAYCRHPELNIELDLTVITTSDSQGSIRI